MIKDFENEVIEILKQNQRILIKLYEFITNDKDKEE